MSTHGDICVKVDPQVSNYSYRLHRCVTNTNRTSWDLMLTSSGWTPEHPSLGRVKLQPVGRHPQENFVNADRQTLPQCVNMRRVAKPIDLSVICIAHTRLTALFLGLPRWASTRKVKTNLDFTEARDSELQWYQLGHMQICTSLQTDNHASTPPFSFLQAGCPSCRPTNSVKALKGSSEVSSA